MSILILAEHDNKTLNPQSLSAITAAMQLAGDIAVLVAGKDCIAVAEAAAKIKGVAKILHADGDAYAHGIAENITPLLMQLCEGDSYSHVLAAATTYGKNILPGLAALKDMAQISDVIAIESADTFRRPIYAGNAIAKVQSRDAVKIMTIRSTAFDPAPENGGAAKIESIAATGDAGKSRFVKLEESQSDRPDLASARVVISGGRGMQNAEGFKLLDGIAAKLGAAIGASRAAVDDGFAPNDYQVGQTGKVVAPELYIAVGISGAIQHLAGMMDSKIIVAINKDPEAPICGIADYRLIGDLFEILPELEKALD